MVGTSVCGIFAEKLLLIEGCTVMDDKCYFCETEKDVTQKLYIFKCVDGEHIPEQVSVCAECKAEYEATFPKC